MTGRAFGLELSADFAVSGLGGPPGASPAAAPGPPVRLTRTTQRSIAAAWPAGAEILTDRRGANGRTLLRVEAHPAAGYLITAAGWGTYRISPDAAVIECAPTRDRAWRWQRFLIGQVLPFAAVVRGYEVFHASAVARGEHTLAFAGASEAGKSSIALALLVEGWQLVSDDVLATRVAGDRAVVHPGPGLISIRHRGEADPRPAGLGTVIGRDEQAVRVAVPVHAEPRVLAHFFVLERRATGGLPSVERLDPVDPRLLLGATFNLILQTPERLTRQLDVCACIAATASVHRLTIPSGCRPDDVAALVVDHTRSL